ncbi:MAG TPA: hypothetical protein VHB21_23740, partial [Minicystis sp.]|nr:hypothetical protein [Minicystis sp.]
MTTTAGGAYRRKLTEEDLALDRGHENGEARAKGSVTSRRRHDLVVGNIVGELRAALRDVPAEVYPEGMRVRVQGPKAFAPD